VGCALLLARPPGSPLFPYTTLFRSEARAIADAERRLLEVMFERLSLTSPRNVWYPVLTRRVATIRERAKALAGEAGIPWDDPTRSEEHTSELQSRFDLVCRLLLETK